MTYWKKQYIKNKRKKLKERIIRWFADLFTGVLMGILFLIVFLIGGM